MRDKIQQTFTFSENERRERLDQALAKLLPEFSRTQIKAWLENGAILIDGQQKRPKDKIKGYEVVTINVTLTPQTQCEPQFIPLDIVYEDEALMIINKPAGLVVHPGAGNRDQTLLNAVLYHAPALENLPRAGILHRLDKNTSGLLVIAKTAEALKSLNTQLKKRKLTREYQAIATGILISGGTVNAPIARHPMARKQMAVVETGKEAITHYRVIEQYRAHTLLAVRLETGRTHQIRVHLSHIHHPILGDVTYGGRVKLAKGMLLKTITALRQFKRQALHACALGFTHPVTAKAMRFEVPLPEDMQNLIELLREDKKAK